MRLSKWTEEEDAELEARVEAGEGVRRVARSLDRSAQAGVTRLRELRRRKALSYTPDIV